MKGCVVDQKTAGARAAGDYLLSGMKRAKKSIESDSDEYIKCSDQRRAMYL